MPIPIPPPIKPPTPAELRVLFWAVVIILIGFVVVCLYFGYRAPPEKAKDAARLIHNGYVQIGAGVALVVIRRFFCGFSS